ncbi:MAG: hypothetical protein AB8G18_17520 [Gammaproteobacteria bacterium]
MSISATALVQIIALIAFVWYCLTYLWPGLKEALKQREAARENELRTLSQKPDFKTESEVNDRSSL